MCVFQSPVIAGKPTPTSIDVVSRLAEILMALPESSRRLMLAWVAEDVPGDVFLKQYVEPL